jgi:hypothetical protein
MRLRMEWNRAKTEHLPPAARGPFKRGDKLLQAQTKHTAKGPEFHYVDAPFTTFAFADEGLRLTHLIGKFNLGHTSTPPRLAEDPEEHGVVGGVDCLLHCGAVAMDSG